MLLLVRTIVEAPDSGWGAPETIAAFVLSIGLLAAFVAVERRAAQPLVRLGIFRSAPLVRANLGAMCLFGAYVGFQFVGTLYLQTTLGWSGAGDRAGVPARRPARRVRRAARRRADQPLRHGASRSAVERVAFAIGYALFLRVDATPYVLTFLPTMLLVGAASRSATRR